MTFQAGLGATEVDFKVEEEDAKPEPLRMEHFYFPLGMWLVGILLSVFSFLTEIIIHRLGKSKTDIPNTRLEEPGITQSTPESENLTVSEVRARARVIFQEEVEHENDVDIEDI